MKLYILYIVLCIFSRFFSYSGSRSPFPLLIVISFDGFRFDYLDKLYLPHFSTLIKNGVRAKWMDNLFITKTLPNHFSIVTGLYQESHGIIGNVMFDPLFNETFDFDNVDPKWWDNGFSMPIWIANQAVDPHRYSGGCLWPGADVWFHNRRSHYTFMYENSSWHHRVDCVVSWMTDPFQPANCVFMYFEEPDIAGHQYGPNSHEVLRQITRADRTLGYLMRRLQEVNLFQDVNMIILSDHGMAEVPFENNVEMGTLIPLDKVKVIGSTPIWQIRPKKTKDLLYIYQLLKQKENEEPYEVFLQKNIPDHFHYRNHRRVAPIVVVAHLHHGLVSRKSPIPSSEFTRGQHGYPSSMIHMKPVFVAHGPAFRRGFLAEPFLNIHLYPLMCHILKIPVAPNNGSLQFVKQLLAHPPD